MAHLRLSEADGESLRKIAQSLKSQSANEQVDGASLFVHGELIDLILDQGVLATTRKSTQPS